MLLLAAAHVCWAAASSPVASETQVGETEIVVRRAFLMGTEATFQMYSENREEALGQLERFILILEETEAELSTWRTTSTLSHLNRLSLQSLEEVPERLCELISTLYFWNRKTAGAFDPAVGALRDTWDLRGRGRKPSRAEILKALDLTGLARFKFDGCVIQRLTDASLDAGAFGKGEALKRVLAKANSAQTAPFLIDFGGQVAVWGLPPDQPAWEVDLSVPGRRLLGHSSIWLKKGSIATSGSFLRDRWVEGIRVGHLLDPRTGRPAEFAGSVTVWHEDPLVADILSTALFVMGPNEGLQWAEREQVAARYQWFETDGGIRSMESRFFGELETCQGE